MQVINQKPTTAEKDSQIHQSKQESAGPELQFKIQTQKDQIAKLEEEISALKTQQKPILDANATLMENFRDLQSKNAELETRVLATDQHLAATIFSLNGALKKAESEKQKLASDSMQLREKVKVLENQISEVESIRTTYLESVARSTQDFNSIKQENESLQKYKGILETQKKELEETVKQAEASKKLEILLTTAQMKKQLEQSSAEALAYKMQLESQKQEFALKQQELDMQIAELSLAIDKLKADHEKTKSDNSNYLARVLKVIDEKKELTQSLDDLRAENEALKAQIQALSQPAPMVYTALQPHEYVPHQYAQPVVHTISAPQQLLYPSHPLGTGAVPVTYAPVGYTPASPGFLQPSLQGAPYYQHQ